MATRGVQRHSRRVRWFHAGVYLSTLALLVTGWWLMLGGEGNPSPLARAFGMGDTSLHVWVGRALAILALVPLVMGRKGVATFARETLRRDRGDGRWWVRWPAAMFTGRFGRHEGHFDPGQRVANVLIVGGLLVLVGTGLGLTALHGGPLFARLAMIHRWTTYLVTALIAGHVLIALGVLPGYRGVWRSMHLRGRVPEATARRVWPGWTERAITEAGENGAAPREKDISPVETPPSLKNRVQRAIARDWVNARRPGRTGGRR
jgi:cytochrome b subunit of formate dehydrogenase